MKLKMEKLETKKLKEKLEKKFNITINFINKNKKIVLFYSIILGVFPSTIAFKYSDLEEKYDNAKVVHMQNEYNLDDIYVVYNKDQVWFCTRKIFNISTAEKTISASFLGTGTSETYEYRKKIYEYLDIKTGQKICQDDEKDFFIEKLRAVYSSSEAKEDNYSVNLKELEEEKDLDNLLSREPKLRQK